MKTKLTLVGVGLLVFGLVNQFIYLPISLSIALKNRPFPFEHLYNVVPSDGHGTQIQIGYMPLDEAANDPYWLFWSLALYSGIIITGYGLLRK